MRIEASVIAFACTVAMQSGCQEATPNREADPPERTSASDPTGADDGARDVGSDGPSRGDGARAPDGCLLTTTGFRSGTVARVVPVATDDGSEAVWSAPEHALRRDGAFAEAALAGERSMRLAISGFGFDVPLDATTWGIEVELARRAPEGGIRDGRVDVRIEGKPSRYKFVEGHWPTAIVGVHHYGQAIDTWGVDLVAADVDSEAFAITIDVARTEDAVAGDAPRATIDALRVAVHFCTTGSAGLPASK